MHYYIIKFRVSFDFGGSMNCEVLSKTEDKLTNRHIGASAFYSLYDDTSNIDGDLYDSKGFKNNIHKTYENVVMGNYENADITPITKKITLREFNSFKKKSKIKILKLKY